MTDKPKHDKTKLEELIEDAKEFVTKNYPEYADRDLHNKATCFDLRDIDDYLTQLNQHKDKEIRSFKDEAEELKDELLQAGRLIENNIKVIKANKEYYKQEKLTLLREIDKHTTIASKIQAFEEKIKELEGEGNVNKKTGE